MGEVLWRQCLPRRFDGSIRMIDKSILREYLDACALVKETEEDLRILRTEYEQGAVDIVKGSNPVFPYQPMNFHVEGISYAKYRNPDEIKRMEAILKERKEIAKEKKLAVEAWINTIPTRIQRIVRFRYIMGYTWYETGNKMGGASAEAVRMEFTRFMSDAEKKV